MKKVIILVLMSLMVAAMLHASIISKAEQYVNEMNTLLVAIGVLVGTALGVWYQIRDHKKKDSLKDELTKAAVPLIMEAKDSPLTILQKLSEPPQVNLATDANNAKNKIVAAALLEAEPKKTKKIKPLIKKR